MPMSADEVRIVAWLRSDAHRARNRARQRRSTHLRESEFGHALMLDLIAKQIEEGDHRRTPEQVRERFATALGLASRDDSGATERSAPPDAGHSTDIGGGAK